MAKISALPVLATNDVDGTEALPVVKDGQTVQTPGQALVARLAQPYVAAAESASGPTYPDTAAGLAATANGEGFAVDNGDGTVTVYLNDAGVAVAQRTLATTYYLASENGAGAINWLRGASGAIIRSLADWLDDELSVMDFISFAERVKIRLRTSTADLSAAFNAASVAAGVNGSVKVPRGLYYCESAVDILDGQTWKFEGATISHTDDTATILRADSKTGFSLLGRLFLKGTLVAAETAAELGLHITNGKRYRVEGITATNFKGVAIQLDGTTTGGTALRGDRGQLTDCSAHNSTVGLNIASGAGAEYNTHTNFTASGNITGVVLDAGNNTFVGGNIVDNTNGINLTGVGANHGHGMLIGTNINHNTSSNFHAQNVTRGFTLLGCHIYGNANGSQGNIWLENSKGILIAHGVIDAWIYNDTGGASGINRVVGNYLPTNYVGSPLANTALQSNNGGLGELEVLDNWTYSGPAALNDPAPVYVRASRGGATQALTSGQNVVVIWNSESLDKRGAYDTATGVFTAPVTGIYRMTVAVTITGGALSAPYGSFRVNGALDRYCGGTAVSATVNVITGTAEIALSAGDTLDFTANVTGTTPVVAVNSTKMSIALVR